MAKVGVEKQKQPSPVWTVDPLLSYSAANQEHNASGAENVTFYDSESGLCTKLYSARMQDSCPEKRSSWTQEEPVLHYSRKQCNSRLIVFILIIVILFLLVATIATVAYFAVGEVQLTWESEELQENDKGISLVEGHLRITNRVFSKDLTNPNSQYFQKLSAQVKQSMDAVFQQSGLGPYYNETGVMDYKKGSVIVRCMTHLLKPRLDATHQVGMAVIQALERYHGYLPGGLLQVDIRSLHFTGLLSNDEIKGAEVLRLSTSKWGPWSDWSPCAEPCEVQTRFRECLNENGKKIASSSKGLCNASKGGNREVRNCPCDIVTRNSTAKPTEVISKSAECAGDCEDGQICILLSETSVLRCLVPRDVNDPTGCGGWCVGENEHCKELGKDMFQCIENTVQCEDDHRQWRCENGLCIPKKGRCDGQLDCYDMSDELHCDCSAGESHCGNNTSCLPLTLFCNGRIECWDGSDELNCTQSCSNKEYTCNNGQCVDKLHFCDGYSDCSDGSDEPEGCNAPCLHTQSQCKNGRCVNVLLWCNGVDNCGDKSDEIACDSLQEIS